MKKGKYYLATGNEKDIYRKALFRFIRKKDSRTIVVENAYWFFVQAEGFNEFYKVSVSQNFHYVDTFPVEEVSFEEGLNRIKNEYILSRL